MSDLARMTEMLGSPEVARTSRELVAAIAYKRTEALLERVVELAVDPARAGAQIMDLAATLVAHAHVHADSIDVTLAELLNATALAQEEGL